jgi:hypothetical protein
MLDSLIFNLYTTLRVTDKAKINVSLYGVSVGSLPYNTSSVYESASQYIPTPKDLNSFLVSMERLLSSEIFFQDIEALMNFNSSD